MQADLAVHFPDVASIYEQASDVLGYDLWALVQEGPAEKLAQTTVTQPAMLAAGVAAYRAWLAAGGIAAKQLAGHSLGEYSALVCANAMDFATAMNLVKRRSELMQDAVPAGVGAMAAIIGMDDDAVGAVCREASALGVAEAVNFNSPGQVVIAGHRKAVDKAVLLAQQQGARRAIVLPVSVPSHSSLMRPAGEALAAALADADIRNPDATVVSAATGTAYVDAEDIRHKLSAQVYGPVLWVRTIQTMIDGGATRFIEAGPGRVLAGLIRRIDKSPQVAAIEDAAAIEKALEA
jgi:[acyl-carrier-protein] S-malonyltransferase